mmetsp:Transcript_33690/g.61911  ORF Transcript_33690/g.61911 Transcript_33690/m.61911 type:complete len:95 (-) Transcript_33690:216-500(-)
MERVRLRVEGNLGKKIRIYPVDETCCRTTHVEKLLESFLLRQKWLFGSSTREDWVEKRRQQYAIGPVACSSLGLFITNRNIMKILFRWNVFLHP